MKDKVSKKNDYSLYKKKIFLEFILLMLSGLGFLFVLSIILRGRFGNWIVNLMEDTFYISNMDARTIHQYLFRENMDLIMISAYIIFSIVIFRFIISRGTRYFDEISKGMDSLMNDSTQEIRLSPEMSVLENKLNMYRNKLSRRENEAKQAEQRKNDLVVYLAHDIRTPLTSVIGYLDLMSEITDMPAEQREKYMKITLDKANRLEKLINEFFEITRYSLQSITLDKQSFNLSYMLFQMADEFYPMLDRKKQEAEVYAQDSIIFYGDPDKLARVFNNVLKNAIAYGYENTKIIINVYTEEESTVITFKNEGQTIPQQKLSNIFEKFYRVDEARGTQTGNAGLGLAITKEIVHLHEGEIYAESNNGITIFYIKLPNNVKI